MQLTLGYATVCRILLVVLSLQLLLPWHVAALEVPPAPTDIPIVDQTQTLNDTQKAELAGIIVESRAKTGNEIGVLIIPTLEQESLEEFSIKTARSWGIGSSERDSGVLLLIVKEDRKVRIEVGYGLEGALTDIESGRIIRNIIAPQFQQDNYYEGIRAGVTEINAQISGEGSALTETEPANMMSVPWEMILFGLFFIPTWLASILARTKSWWAGGVIGAVAGVIVGLLFGFMLTGIISIILLTIIGLLFDKSVSSNYQEHARRGDAPSWWTGGTHLGGGGSRGGGFGGFSGGGFGGGGSSGSW